MTNFSGVNFGANVGEEIIASMQSKARSAQSAASAKVKVAMNNPELDSVTIGTLKKASKNGISKSAIKKFAKQKLAALKADNPIQTAYKKLVKAYNKTASDVAATAKKMGVAKDSVVNMAKADTAKAAELAKNSAFANPAFKSVDDITKACKATKRATVIAQKGIATEAGHKTREAARLVKEEARRAANAAHVADIKARWNNILNHHVKDTRGFAEKAISMVKAHPIAAAAIGLATLFTGYMLLKPSKANQPAQQ